MTFAEGLSQGGWAMVPILMCSIATMAVFFEKVAVLRRARLKDTRWVERMMDAVRAGDLKGARAALVGCRHPGSRVADATLAIFDRRPDRAEAEARRVGSLAVQDVERRASLLAFMAQITPLLGLLGTVLGMLELFLGLEGAGLRDVDVEQLSHGIWKALLTTAAGLAVAVPALAAHAWVTSRADALRLHIADVVQRLLNEAPLEGYVVDRPDAASPPEPSRDAPPLEGAT